MWGLTTTLSRSQNGLPGAGLEQGCLINRFTTADIDKEPVLGHGVKNIGANRAGVGWSARQDVNQEIRFAGASGQVGAGANLVKTRLGSRRARHAYDTHAIGLEQMGDCAGADPYPDQDRRLAFQQCPRPDALPLARELVTHDVLHLARQHQHQQ